MGTLAKALVALIWASSASATLTLAGSTRTASRRSQPSVAGVDTIDARFASGHNRRLLQDLMLEETPNLRLAQLHLQMQMQSQEAGSPGSRNPEERRISADGGRSPGIKVKPHMGPFDSSAKRRARQERAVRTLMDYPRFNLSDPFVVRYAEAVDTYLSPWRPIEGVNDGLGNGRGIISPKIFRAMASGPGFMSCCGHIKIVNGHVFYRYGGFLPHWYRNRRFILTVKTIELAIKHYRLRTLSAELFINTCDEPISFDSAVAEERGGYPIFSTEFRPGTIDIPFPDPLDLSKGYMSQGPTTVPWSERKSKAVFRGATTNYNIHNDTNWRVSPRIRIHKMTEVRPDLLDASLTRWSHVKLKSSVRGMAADGIRMAKPVDRMSLEGYKYELVVDGGGGTCRTCGVLASQRVMIRQESTYSQFFQPLLVPYIHFIPTKHFWEDTYEQIEWAQSHDDFVQHILPRANQVARYACTWEGRALYWAILLVKYSREAMELPELVKEPAELCSHAFPLEVMSPEPPQVRAAAFPIPPGWPPLCTSGSVTQVQPRCTLFCEKGRMRFPEQWLSVASLSHITLE